VKKGIIVMLVLIPVLLAGPSCKKSGEDNPLGPQTGGLYKNGVYEGSLPRDGEGYSTSTRIEVSGNRIADVDWSIYDNNLKRYFDETYEEVYTGNPTYMQQCRDNMRGMLAYGPKLIMTQEIDSVDVITLATWCHNKFKQVVKKALVDARLDTTASSH
jgi:major membrane immunogen (membrane-anchored lipoprotein)